MPSEHQWDIDVNLLTPHGSLWSNLGAWEPPCSVAESDLPAASFDLFSPTKDYVEACQNLATLVGHAASLRPGMRILELACGYGASIDLWVKQFDVASVDVMDIRPHCIAAIKARSPQGLGLCLTGSADDLGRFITPHGPLHPQSYDAIVCVDAAYHFARLADVLAAASMLLKPNGQLGWTSLLAPDESQAHKKSLLERQILRLASIPSSAILSRRDLTSHLVQASLSLETLIYLNNNVFKGFAEHVKRRSREVALVAKLSPSWWKIRGTGIAAAHLYRTGSLQYALFGARRAG